MSKDMQKTEEKTNRRMPTFTESVIPIIAMMVILTVGKGYLGYATEPLLLLVAAIAGLIAYRVGVTWDEMMDEICQKIAKGMPAILILTCVGALVGTWMASGTIPMMIYYGVQIVNPTFMLVTAFLITAVVSIVTGTSWGSVATMGVALMGIASTLGVNLAATAGAVIDGSYFLHLLTVAINLYGYLAVGARICVVPEYELRVASLRDVYLRTLDASQCAAC